MVYDARCNRAILLPAAIIVYQRIVRVGWYMQSYDQCLHFSGSDMVIWWYCAVQCFDIIWSDWYFATVLVQAHVQQVHVYQMELIESFLQISIATTIPSCQAHTLIILNTNANVLICVSRTIYFIGWFVLAKKHRATTIICRPATRVSVKQNKTSDGALVIWLQTCGNDSWIVNQSNANFTEITSRSIATPRMSDKINPWNSVGWSQNP